MVNAGDFFPFFDKSMNPFAKKGIRNLNIEELELRAIVKMMETKFSV